jgi:hypothetical protein
MLELFLDCVLPIDQARQLVANAMAQVALGANHLQVHFVEGKQGHHGDAAFLVADAS